MEAAGEEDEEKVYKNKKRKKKSFSIYYPCSLQNVPAKIWIQQWNIRMSSFAVDPKEQSLITPTGLD